MRKGSALEVLLVFLKLGATSFGGPIAHIGYFREEFVVRRRWLEDAAYADLVALCQSLPGPASSQVGFSVGLMRAGYWGGLVAWIGFTLPSALLMTAFAFDAQAFSGRIATGIQHGLEFAAVSIVAQAVWGMARTLCKDRIRASIATLAVVIFAINSSSLTQIGTLVLGGMIGWWLCKGDGPPASQSTGFLVSRRVGIVALCLYFLLLIVLPATPKLASALSLFAAFYHSGALVFGGGHVALPLLNGAIVAPGWVSQEAFLAGYGAAQGMPGPLFTFAAYLGAIAHAPNHFAGAALGLIGIFLPGMIILIGALPFWNAFQRHPKAQAVLHGINAAVVGLLGAALYNPLFVTAVKTPGDFAAALVGFILLVVWRTPPLVVVVLGMVTGVCLVGSSR